MASIWLAGTMEAEYRKGIDALVDAHFYLVDLYDQLARWADDGGMGGDATFGRGLPPFPPRSKQP